MVAPEQFVGQKPKVLARGWTSSQEHSLLLGSGSRGSHSLLQPRAPPLTAPALTSTPPHPYTGGAPPEQATGLRPPSRALPVDLKPRPSHLPCSSPQRWGEKGGTPGALPSSPQRVRPDQPVSLIPAGGGNKGVSPSQCPAQGSAPGPPPPPGHGTPGRTPLPPPSPALRCLPCLARGLSTPSPPSFCPASPSSDHTTLGASALRRLRRGSRGAGPPAPREPAPLTLTRLRGSPGPGALLQPAVGSPWEFGELSRRVRPTGAGARRGFTGSAPCQERGPAGASTPRGSQRPAPPGPGPHPGPRPGLRTRPPAPGVRALEPAGLSPARGARSGALGSSPPACPCPSPRAAPGSLRSLSPPGPPGLVVLNISQLRYRTVELLRTTAPSAPGKVRGAPRCGEKARPPRRPARAPRPAAPAPPRVPRAPEPRLRVPSARATRGPAAASVRPRRLLSHAAALPRRRNATAPRWPDRFFRAGRLPGRRVARRVVRGPGTCSARPRGGGPDSPASRPRPASPPPAPGRGAPGLRAPGPATTPAPSGLGPGRPDSPRGARGG